MVAFLILPDMEGSTERKRMKTTVIATILSPCRWQDLLGGAIIISDIEACVGNLRQSHSEESEGVFEKILGELRKLWKWLTGLINLVCVWNVRRQTKTFMCVGQSWGMFPVWETVLWFHGLVHTNGKWKMKFNTVKNVFASVLLGIWRIDFGLVMKQLTVWGEEKGSVKWPPTFPSLPWVDPRFHCCHQITYSILKLLTDKSSTKTKTDQRGVLFCLFN